MIVPMGTANLELGGPQLGYLREANHLLGNASKLRERMAEDGYLLLRGLQRRENVEQARRSLVDALAANEQLADGHPAMDAVVREGARGGFHGGSKALTRSKSFLDVVESPEIMGFFADYYEADVLTYDYKWLRVVAPGDFTGSHYDIVYMGRGTQNVCTCWTPLGDITYDMGPLAILAGSGQSEQLEKVRQTYGKMDVDRDHVTGSFSNDPVEMVEKFGGTWQTSEFQMGDVLIFGMFTMHASLTNTSNRFRLTADTRYQRADEPVDERWVGDNPMAHYAWMSGDQVSMEDARRQWKV